MVKTYDLHMRISSLKDDYKYIQDIDEFLCKIMDETQIFISNHSNNDQTSGDIHVRAVVTGNETKPLMARKSMWSFMESFKSMNDNTIKNRGYR